MNVRLLPHPTAHSVGTTFVALLTRGALLLTVLVGVVLSLAFCYQRLLALRFHTKDFPYYLQFAAKLFDPALSPRYSINPEGFNFLGFYGMEGVFGFHQSIHFEPIKYGHALLYALWGEPMALFGFVALVFFAPLLYLAIHHPRQQPLDNLFALLVALVYTCLPAVPFAVSYDLRPYTYLLPFFFLAFLAITYQRPRLEIAFLYQLLFLAREEALILGGILILYAASIPSVPVATRRQNTSLLLGSWLGWAVVTALYFWWAGYPSQGLGAPVPLEEGDGAGASPLAWFPLLGAMLLLPSYGAWWWVRREQAMQTRHLFTLALVLLPLAWQYRATFAGSSTLSVLQKSAYSPRWLLLWGTLLLLTIPLWQVLQRPKQRQMLCVGLGAALLLCVGLHGASSEAALAKLRRDQGEQAATALVLALRAQTDHLTSSILTDKWGYQAFYDYEYVYDYQRLPAYLVPRESQRYPENTAALQALIEREVEFVVMHEKSQEALLALIATTPVQRQLTFRARNDSYLIYQILRPGARLFGHTPPLDFGAGIRLASVEVTRARVKPGEQIGLTLMLQRLDEMSHDYSILVRLVGADGRELWRAEGWPWGAPTSQWPTDELRPDGHTMVIPADAPPGPATLLLRFYDPTTLSPLPAIDPTTGHTLDHPEQAVGQIEIIPAD